MGVVLIILLLIILLLLQWVIIAIVITDPNSRYVIPIDSSLKYSEMLISRSFLFYQVTLMVFKISLVTLTKELSEDNSLS